MLSVAERGNYGNGGKKEGKKKKKGGKKKGPRK